MIKKNYEDKENYITDHTEVYWWRGHANASIIASSVRAVGPIVADFGCNHGACTTLMSEYNKRVTGFDINQDAIDLADLMLKQCSNFVKKHVEFKQSSFFKLDCDKDYFTGAYMLDVFEHLYPEDRKKIFGEIKRVMKKDGVLVISTPYGNVYDCPEHVDHYDVEKLSKILDDLQLEVGEIKRWEGKDLRGESHDQIHVICKFKEN